MIFFTGFSYRPQGDGEPTYAISRSGDNHLPQDDNEPASGSDNFNHPPQDDSEPSSGSYFNHPPPGYGETGAEPRYAIHRDYDEPRYVINVTIMISALIVLLLVVLLVIFLHVYARWFWRQSARFSRRRSASRRRPVHFTRQEPARLRNVGLDPAILETLPIFLYKSQNFTDSLDCAVCLCELEENEKARLLPNCRHSFHVECIDMWFLSHSTCPLCRTAAQTEQPVSDSARIEQVSVIHLNSEQGQTASSGEENNLLTQEHPWITGDIPA